MTTTPPTLEKFGAAYLRLSHLLSTVGAAQWRPGQTVRPAEDTTERSKGMTSDPTFAAVSDERRLKLRAAVIEAEHALSKAGRALQAAERHLGDAMTEWNNE